MKHLVRLLIVLFPLWLSAQTDTLNTREEMIFSDPELPATFPGGHAALKKFIADNLQLPSEMQNPHAITVKVWLKFHVSETGKLSQINVEGKMPECAACAAEALRIVQLMPDWIPGSINGKTVDSWFVLPIKFDPLTP